MRKSELVNNINYDNCTPDGCEYVVSSQKPDSVSVNSSSVPWVHYSGKLVGHPRFIPMEYGAICSSRFMGYLYGYRGLEKTL